MNRKLAIILGVAMLVGASGIAVSGQAYQSAGAKGGVTAPISDDELRKLGVRSLTVADIDKMKGTLALLEIARRGGSAGGLNYNCDSIENKCSCNGPIDCINMGVEECRTIPVDSSGKACTGDHCTCRWH